MGGRQDVLETETKKSYPTVCLAGGIISEVASGIDSQSKLQWIKRHNFETKQNKF